MIFLIYCSRASFLGGAETGHHVVFVSVPSTITVHSINQLLHLQSSQANAVDFCNHVGAAAATGLIDEETLKEYITNPGSNENEK